MLLYLKNYKNIIENYNSVQLVCRGKWGLLNKSRINDYFRFNFKLKKGNFEKYFIFRNVNEDFKKLDEINITEIEKEEWVAYYNRPDTLAFYNIEKNNNGIFVFSRIKSDSGYCNLNCLI